MDSSDSSTYCIRPYFMNMKNFKYKGKSYPVDFDLLTKNSIFFHNNKDKYENTNDIDLIEGPIELDDDVIQSFIICCENTNFPLNDSNIFGIRQLSCHYKVSNLTKIINEYIKKKPDLFLKSCFYNILQNENELTKQKDEEFISDNFIKIIHYDDLLICPVSTLHRILYNYRLNNDNLNEAEEKEIIDFLFKYLKKNGKNASVLFQNLNLLRNNIIPRLINEYHDIFDFGMIDSQSLFQQLMKYYDIIFNGYNKLMQINKKNDDFISVINQKVDAKLTEINKSKEKLLKMIKHKDEQIKKINNEKSELDLLIINQNEEINNLKNQLKENCNKYQNENSKLIGKIKKMKNQMKNQKDISQKQQDEDNDLNNKINQLKDTIKKMEDQLKEQLNEENNLKNQNNQLKNKIKEMKTQIANQQNEENDLKIQNNQFKNKIIEMKKHILNQQNEYKSRNQNEYNVIKDENDRLKQQIIQIKNDIIAQQNIIQKQEEEDNEIKNEKEQLNQILSDAQYLLNQKLTINKFNKLKGESQNFLISKIIDNNDNNSELIQNLSKLLRFLSSEQRKVKYSNNFNNYIYIEPIKNKESFNSIQNIDLIEINHKMIESLYKNRSIDSPDFIDCINHFNNVCVDIEYPTDHFEMIYQILMDIKKQHCSKLKIGLYINKFELDFNYFQNDKKEIYSVKINCNEIPGGYKHGRFENCTLLERLILLDSVVIIGDGSFNGCINLKFLSLGKNVQYIGNSAFNDCISLINVSFPPSLREIQDLAFQNCHKLNQKEINIDNISIYGNPFAGCFESHKKDSSQKSHPKNETNKSISIPKSNPPEFSEDNTLNNSNISNPEKNSDNSDEDEIDYTKIPKNKLNINPSINIIDSRIKLNKEILTYVVIPDSIEKIGGYAFLSCPELIRVDIPETVNQIGNDAFKDCKKLRCINLPNKLQTISPYSFSGCHELRDIIIPPNVKNINIFAFCDCKNLQQIIIPSSVKSIMKCSFQGCTKISKVIIHTIGSKLTIGDNVFIGCTSLKEVIFNASSLISIGSNCFNNCTALKQIIIPSFVDNIGESAFYNCSSLAQIIFEKNSKLNEIKKGTFENCTSLNTIEIPANVSRIKDNAFYNCTSLNNIIIENDSKLVTIESNVISYCTLLTQIKIPYSINYINGKAFNASSLKKVLVPSSLKENGKVISSMKNIAIEYFD